MVVSLSNRRFIRHKNGTVIIWYDRGVKKETLVFDSCYRTFLKWSTTNTIIKTIDCCCEGYGYIANSNDERFDPHSSSQNALHNVASDNFLDSRGFFKDSNSSTFNTQAIIKHDKSSLTAANYCYTLDAALPNLQTLVRIFCDGCIIDQLDPTVTNNKDKSLSVCLRGWFSTNIPFAWSSSQFDFYYAWGVLSSGLVGTVGKSDLVGGVIPVMEV